MTSRFSTCVRAAIAAAAIFTIGAQVQAQCPGANQVATPKSPSGTISPTAARMHYQWNPSTGIGIQAYAVFLKANGGNATAECSASGQSTDTCDGSVLPAGSYEWFVRTFATACTSGVDSASQSFVITQPCPTPAAPSLTSPANNSILTVNPPTLNWSASAGADKYDIHLGTTNTPAVFATSLTTSFSPPALSPGTYFWYIEAYPNCDTQKRTRSTQTFSFTIPNCPDAATLQVPAEGSAVSSGNITLTWSAVAGATRYNVFAGINGATPGPVGTTSNTSLTQFLDGGKSIEWYVVSTVPNCNDKTSAHGRFTTVSSCPNSGPTITAPASGSSFDDSKPVTISWTAVSGATGYDILISTDNGASYFQKASVSGSTLSTSIQFAAGSYFVAIRASVTGCSLLISQPASRFSVTPAVVCPTAKPVLVSPASGATVTLPVTFDWNDVADATGYNLYVVTSTTTSPLTLVGSTTKSELTVTSLPSNTQSWFVQAVFGNNCSPTESNRNNLTVSSVNCGTQTTTLVSPANNATDVGSTVDFDWTDVAGAAAYRLLVGLNGGTPATIAVVTDSHFQTSLQNGSAVEWYVEVIYNTQCPAIASSRFKFTVAAACTTVAPTLVSPADGATNLTSPVTLQWTAVPGATSYKVFAAAGIANTAQIGETTATQLSAQLPAGSVSWFVQAVLPDGCASTVSKRGTFTVGSGTQCNNSPATLKSPADGATNVKSPVELEWSKVDGATKYTIFVSYNGSAFVNFGTTTETNVERIIPAGTVSWYVVTSFAGCDDVRSSTATFTVVNDQTCPTGTISLTTPAAGATVNSPVAFAWTTINGTSSYRLWVSSNGEAFLPLARTANTNGSIALPSGATEAYVEALFGDLNATTNTCPSITSPHVRFTVAKAANCDNNKAAVPVSPTGTRTNTSIDFTWNAAAGAIAYRLWVAASGQPFADIALTTLTQITRDVPAGSYTWFVETIFDGCPTIASNKLEFKVETSTSRCNNSAPSLISPADKATNVASPVTFLWSSVPNAEKYRVYVSVDGGAIQFAGETTDTSLTSPVPPGSIKWAVEASFKECKSTLSAQATFTVPKSQNCFTDGAQLVAPANGSTVATFDVDLIWNAVSGASDYVLWMQRNDGAPTAIARTGDTHKQLRLPDGKFEWWVTTFVSGCPSIDSLHFTFTFPPDPCDNRKPLLQSPRDGSFVTQPVIFTWTAVAKATGYRIYASADNNTPNLVDTVGAVTQSHPVTLPAGTIQWAVEALFDAPCGPTISAIGVFHVIKPPACAPPLKPVASLPAQVATDTTYALRWDPLANAEKFEVQESTTTDFAAPSITIVASPEYFTSHTATDKPVQYFYRVRGISSCSDASGPYSDVVGIVVVPQKPQSKDQHQTGELGFNGNIVQTIFLPGTTPPVTFTATIDKPWLSVVPSTGTLGPAGVTLQVIASGGLLLPGTNTGTVHVTYGSGGASNGAHTMVTPVNIPVSVSLVTPVTPGGKNTPPPDSLIIPAVGHAAGIGGSLFESDVRLANVSAQTMKYQLNFTAAGTDGTQSGNSTTVQVEPGATMALDDIMANFFGNSGIVGTLEIRPLTSTTTTSAFTSTSTPSQSLTTVVSSRTYNSTTAGTYGQFVPAVPFAQFIAKASDATQKQILSLQQIAQSTAYRTNLGLIEGSGEAASVLLSVFDSAGNRIAQIPQNLTAGGFIQIDHILADNHITLNEGRIEVEVTSATGRVTAYASVLDNITSDPLLVPPVLKSAVGSNRYTLPGVGDFDIGFAHWKSDVRIFNAGATRTDATLTYYPQGAPGSPKTTTISVDPGEVKAINDFIATTFPATATAGSLAVTTPSSSSLVVTGRTYTDLGAGKGSYGQFIPAMTPADSTSLGGRTLQVLQLEASDRYRTNIGIFETSGNPVSVEVSVILPDSRVTPKTTYTLAPNEFRQISLGADFGLTNVYNVRATMRVTSGTGKIAAYGSVIDATTQDPTYVWAQ